jgi:predicted deacylase
MRNSALKEVLLPRGTTRIDPITQIQTIAKGGPVEPDSKISGVWRVWGGVHGNSVTISAGVHGNEPSGVWAMTKVIREITDGTIQLQQGSITFVLGNEEALRLNVRCIKYNLNRLFGRPEIGEVSSYECIRARQLGKFYAEADGVLDLHSTSSKSPAFCLTYKENSTAAIEMGIPHVLYGGEDLFGTMVRGTTAGWSQFHGIPAFIIESGRHVGPDAFRNAYRYLRSFLDYMGIIPFNVSRKEKTVCNIYRMYECQYLKNRDFTYSREFQTLDWVPGGTAIGSYPAIPLMVDQRSVIVMPTKVDKLQIGEEMYYLAEPTLWS